MCGIAGIVSLSGEGTINEQRLVRMRDEITHRGPDGEGVWIERGVGIAHRRLSIVDVAGGHQPMSNEDGSVWIVFNGEIYNHADLRPGLQARGHQYQTRSDTETIIHGYEEYGDAVVEHLRGMFSFAIWDRNRQRLLIARDRLGIKPLYYAVTDRELLFGSEIKTILAAGGVKPVFNSAVVPEYLAARFVSGEETFYKGIRRLLPGHTLSWSLEQGLSTRRYWQIPAPGAGESRSFAAEAADLRERLRAAVRRHLMSDVPLGLFLSGGIDSTALASMASEMVDEPLRTFSVGFDIAETNELPYARMAAKHVGAVHKEVLVSPDQFFEALPKLIWHEDEPIAFESSVPLYFVSQLASEDVKVVLTGEGADELFLGYNRYRVGDWNVRMGRPYWATTPPAVQRWVRQGISRLPRAARRYLSRTFLGVESGPRSLLLENFAVFPEAMRRDLLSQETASHRRDPYGTMLECYASAEGGVLDRMSRMDLQTYLHELLMKQDQMSMAASIESRVPFLDDSIIEHVAAMPSRLKLRGLTTKAVLRAAVKDMIPREILERPKMGFPVPIGHWLRGRFRPIVDEFVLGPRTLARGLFDPAGVQRLTDAHQRGAEYGDRLWLLINLEIWQRTAIDGESPNDVMRGVGRGLIASATGAAAVDRMPAAAALQATRSGGRP